jgi:hypothetical protein
MSNLLTRLRMDSSYIPGDRTAHMLYERERHEAADRIEAADKRIGELTAMVIEAEKYNGFHQQACLRIAELEAALAWQPIETAPRQGRQMILLLTPSRFPQVAFANTWWTAGFSVENKPTHWMPLPALPSR